MSEFSDGVGGETLQVYLRRILGHEGSDDISNPRYMAERIHHSAMLDSGNAEERCIILPLGQVGLSDIIDAIRAFYSPDEFSVKCKIASAMLVCRKKGVRICLDNQSNQTLPIIYVTVSAT